MIHIAIHILPHEIDQLEQMLIQLKKNSFNLPDDHGIKVEVVLNLSLVDWEESTISAQFFCDKLGYCEELTATWADADFHYGNGEIIDGCNDLRRCVIKSTNHPYIMYLDADNVFSDQFLGMMWNVVVNEMYEEGDHLYDKVLTESYKSSYKIFTPETTRMWDSTWDCITNYHHLAAPASHEAYENRDPYSIAPYLVNEDNNLRLISGFKFAGWGTTIDTRLARLISIPDSLGSYGLDDTFVMYGCQMMKDKGYDVKQYVIEDEVIIENNKFRFNPYKDYLVSIDKRQEFLSQAQANFQPELQKLKDRI